MKTSLSAPTRDEADRMDDFRLIGCVACWLLGYPETPYDVHHHLSGTSRLGHWATVPLCPAHHRGVGYSEDSPLASVAVSQHTFRDVFGHDHVLRTITNQLLIIKRRQYGLPQRRDFLSSLETA